MRHYIQEETIGIPVDLKTSKQRRALIGKLIEWNDAGWISKSSGIIEDVCGKNILVNGDWKISSSMINVKDASNVKLTGCLPED